MEEENRKLRRAARRDYLDNVRELVTFVKRRDKRVAKFQVGIHPPTMLCLTKFDQPELQKGWPVFEQLLTASYLTRFDQPELPNILLNCAQLEGKQLGTLLCSTGGQAAWNLAVLNWRASSLEPCCAQLEGKQLGTLLCSTGGRAAWNLAVVGHVA
jgi:hypothetical protein